LVVIFSRTDRGRKVALDGFKLSLKTKFIRWRGPVRQVTKPIAKYFAENVSYSHRLRKMVKYSNQAVAVDWTTIPKIAELEFFIGYTLGYYETQELPRLGLKRKAKFVLSENDYIIHKEERSQDLKALYEQNGFETRMILQDPTGHRGTTVACPIGFPFNLPFHYTELKRFNRWICRVHVDISRSDKGFISVPHIEPDPVFHPFDHLWDTYINKRVVRGVEAVKALNALGIK